MSLLVSVLGFATTSCEYVEDFMDYSKLTIIDDGQLCVSNTSAYRDLKVIFNDKEYTSFGTYKIPNNTVVNLSWSYADQFYGQYVDNKDWRSASIDLIVGERESVTVTLIKGSAKIDKESQLF